MSRFWRWSEFVYAFVAGCIGICWFAGLILFGLWVGVLAGWCSDPDSFARRGGEAVVTAGLMLWLLRELSFTVVNRWWPLPPDAEVADVL